jgi:hypothetical protein
MNMRKLQPGDVVRVNRGPFRGPADERIETVEWVSDDGHMIRTEGGSAEAIRTELVATGPGGPS